MLDGKKRGESVKSESQETRQAEPRARPASAIFGLGAHDKPGKNEKTNYQQQNGFEAVGWLVRGGGRAD